MNKNEKEISRGKFLRTFGTIIAGGSVAGISGALLMKKDAAPAARKASLDAFASPYRPIASFEAPGIVKAFAQHGGRLYVAVAKEVSVYEPTGTLLYRFPAGELIRDIAVNEQGIHLLYPSKVEVFTEEGTLNRQWEACSELSNYCALALAEGFVFVTDMENKNICQYTADGAFVRFIHSPNGFVIPSLSFGIEYIDGAIYCSNSGRHLVESYTLTGDYIAAFGAPGQDIGLFTGCCNPVHLTHTSTGEIITSEKGNPRISCYSKDGSFRSLLLDSESLGGGRLAYDVKVEGDKLFVAGDHAIAVYQYQPAQATATACGSCGIPCPLRT